MSDVRTNEEGPKLLFIMHHPYPDFWMDGLYAALQELHRTYHYQVKILNLATEDPAKINRHHASQYDYVLGWGAFASPVDMFLQGWYNKGKIGLCIAGNVVPPSGRTNPYGVLFYETKWYRPQIDFHPNIVHAFGYNAEIYDEPGITVPVVWDFIGVGALADWKRWERMLDRQGSRLVIGEYQDKNRAESVKIADQLLGGGVMVSGMVSPFELVNFYYYSRAAYIPATIHGGGERAVLEAKACGLPVIIEDDNEKLKELVELETPWDHHYYAKQLHKGLSSL